MSAYMVDREHIHYLVAAAHDPALLRGHPLSWRADVLPVSWHTTEETTRDKLGQMLWDENAASINSRYPDTIGRMDRAPGPNEESYSYFYRPLPWGIINPVQVLKSCMCFDYQACEHPGWPTSEAFGFIEALKQTAIHALPGMEQAEWGAPNLPTRPRVTAS